MEVAREGDLGFVDVFVVGFECGGVDLGVGVAVDVVEGWCPCNARVSLLAEQLGR